MYRLVTIDNDPENILRRTAEPIKEFDSEWLTNLFDDMCVHMDEYKGIGLAANQVGVLRRVIVVGPEGDRRLFVNPVVLKTWGMRQGLEGCLSLPECIYMVSRPDRIRLQYQDITGKTKVELFADEVNPKQSGTPWARAIQHEIDHLNGKTLEETGEKI